MAAATPLRLGGRKPRALLARLLLDANRTVSVERLVDDLWGEDVPESAVKMVHIHVSALRKALPGGMLQTRQPGYVLELPPEAIDVVRFERLRAEGRAALDAGDAATAAGPAAERARVVARAGAGRVLRAVRGVEAAHLEERHRVCLEDRIDADLALGRHADLAGELEALVGRNPLRERLRGQLMLALYRSGRQADALAAYRDFRAALDTSSASSRRRGMRELEGRILRQDAALDGSAERFDPRRGMDPIRYVAEPRRLLDRLPGGGRRAAGHRLRARLGVLVPAGVGVARARLVLRAAGAAGPADPVRQARHRAV